MDHGLAHAPVRAADADVFAGAAETALGVALEVGQHQQGIVAEQALAHGHLGKPFAAGHGQHGDAVLVQDIHRAERPAVDGEGLPVKLGGIAVALVIGVGLHNGRAGQPPLHQRLDPGPGDDVGAVLFPRVQLDAHLARQAGAGLVKGCAVGPPRTNRR